MKKRMIGGGIGGGAIALLWCGAPAAAELSLTFAGLKPGGSVAFAIYADDAGWRRRSGAVLSGVEPAAGERLQLRLALPPGEYAVMAYHDRNQNGRMDTLPIGLPTEPYGFSNDSRGTFGPPEWGRARFRLDEPLGRQTIRLR